MRDADLVFNFSMRGRILEALKRNDDAAAAYERARTIAEKTLGDKHPSLSAILQDLGRLHGRMGKTVEARAELDRAIEVAKAGEVPLSLATASRISSIPIRAASSPARHSLAC